MPALQVRGSLCHSLLWCCPDKLAALLPACLHRRGLDALHRNNIIHRDIKVSERASMRAPRRFMPARHPCTLHAGTHDTP